MVEGKSKIGKMANRKVMKKKWIILFAFPIHSARGSTQPSSGDLFFFFFSLLGGRISRSYVILLTSLSNQLELAFLAVLIAKLFSNVYKSPNYNER